MTGEGESEPGTAASQKPGRFQQEVRELGTGDETTGFGDGEWGVGSGDDASETSLGGS